MTSLHSFALFLKSMSNVPFLFVTQVLGEDASGQFKVQMYGADTMCLLQSPREYELSRHMQPPVILDTSEYVLSPMPGTLVSYSVEEGTQVEIGQELCIVEAMKMQNLIKSPRSGVISKLRVPVGSSLMADQIILDFSKEEVEEEQAA